MACVIFFMDKEESHLLSSFGLGHTLKKAGYDVSYINISENEDLIVGQGFSFFLLPEQRDLMSYLTEGRLDLLFEERKPDLILVSSYLLLESLILYYKYNIVPVILTDYLRNPGMSLADNLLFVVATMPGDVFVRAFEYIQSLGIPFDSLSELAGPLAGFRELVLCPRELEIDQQLQDEKIYYTGLSGRPDHDAETFPDLNKIKKEKKIIYTSLGGPAESCEAPFYALLCQQLINAMQHPDLADIYMILSIRHDFELKAMAAIHENLYVTNRIPDMAVIENASLIISHGELSVIKESVCNGIPMMLLPILQTQYRHAMLIEHHRIGISEQIDIITEERLRSSILYLLSNRAIRANVESMKKIFHARGEAQDAAVIQQIGTPWKTELL